MSARHSSTVSAHLTDAQLEALAHGRADLVHGAARAHATTCDVCRGKVEDARSLSRSLDRALDDSPAPALDDADVAALVATAIARAGTARPPSRRALLGAAAIATALLAACAVVSFRGVPTVAGTIAALRDGLHVGVALDRVVHALVPGGWGGLALAAAALALVVAWPLSRIGRVVLRARLLAPAAVLLAALGLAGSAHALELAGNWPAGERVTLTASHAHLSQVLSRAAESAGLGYVGTLSDDPEISVSVRETPLRDFLVAVLGQDAPLRVEHTDTMLVVRPLSTAPDSGVAATPEDAADAGVPSAPPVPPVPPQPPDGDAMQLPPMPPLPPLPPMTSSEHVRDRISFGGDVVVRSGERVRSVVTMGGDADISGEVLGDVTTMGGDIHVRPGATVLGELVSMGGRIDVEPGANVPVDGVRAQLGDGPPQRHRHQDDGPHTVTFRPGDALGEAASDLAGHVARYAMLFLFGLLALALAPKRLAEVMRVVRAEPVRALVVGALSLIGATAITIVLAISIIGIPGAIALVLAATIAGYGGVTAVAIVLGSALPIAAVKGRPLAELAVGVALLALVSFVPFFGDIAMLGVVLLAVGAVVLTRGGKPSPSAARPVSEAPSPMPSEPPPPPSSEPPPA